MEGILATLNTFFTETVITNFLDKGIKIILIILVGKFLVKFIVNAIKKFYEKSTPNMSERKAKTLSNLFCNVAKFGINFLIVYTILNTLGVPSDSMLAFASIFTVAIGLGAQNFVKDIINGFLLLLEDHIGIGDYLNINGYIGIVEEKSLRTTNIRSSDGTLHIIPNSSISVIGNMSKEYSRSILNFRIITDLPEDEILEIFTTELEFRKEEFEETMQNFIVLGFSRKSNGTERIVKVLLDSYFGKQDDNERKITTCLVERLERAKIDIVKG